MLSSKWFHKCKQFGGECSSIGCICNRDCIGNCGDCEWEKKKCYFPINNPSGYKGDYLKMEITKEDWERESRINKAITKHILENG